MGIFGLIGNIIYHTLTDPSPEERKKKEESSSADDGSYRDENGNWVMPRKVPHGGGHGR